MHSAGDICHSKWPYSDVKYANLLNKFRISDIPLSFSEALF